MKCWDMKPILALLTCQEICSDKELEQIEFGKFDLGHPVVNTKMLWATPKCYPIGLKIESVV